MCILTAEKHVCFQGSFNIHGYTENEDESNQPERKGISMNNTMKKKGRSMMALFLAATVAAGTIGTVRAESTTKDLSVESTSVMTSLEQIDNSKWLYNSDDDVYYQLGIVYCETPADAEQEQLSIIVPAAYLTAQDNGDGTYTCELNPEASVNGYTALTAPIVFPVNTPGYSAQSPMTGYTSVKDYTDAGFVYVHAGCRGRDDGAPAGVTDLKAAIRYIRYNSGNIAGDTDRIFSFGMSGGGAQSVLLGVTGDSALYDDYLEAIGAVQGVSDAVLGSQSWCPITSLDSADAAYEWMMATTRTGLSDEEQAISDDLTEAYAEYINSLDLTDEDGNVLTLEASEDGRYQAGSYYEFMKEIIEESLNSFLSNTTFPYDADNSSQGHMAGMGGQRPEGMSEGQSPEGMSEGQGPEGMSEDQRPEGMSEGQGPEGMSEGQIPEGMGGSSEKDMDFTAIDDINRSGNTAQSGVSLSGTYETVQDYIDALNANGEWVAYDEETGTVTITSIADFAEAVKAASKGIAAFDQLDEGQGENTLFGYADGSGAHFDAVLAIILEEQGSEYADDYAEDLNTEDALGHTVDYRLNMYSPLYYLLESQEGYGTSDVAKYFRINTGIWQSDTAVNTEANLALALTNYGSEVDYSFVWGQEHTMAEESGSSTENFIEWVNDCCAQEND